MIGALKAGLILIWGPGISPARQRFATIQVIWATVYGEA
jgi:hypothetical protein